MNDLVVIKDGHAIVSSKKVADVFGKIHRNVLADIKKLDCSDEFRGLNFQLSSYTSSQNKVLPCYELTKDGFAFICMGFTGKKAAKWKEAYINAFNEMEKGLLNADARINLITIKGRELKDAGTEWSAIGRSIRQQKSEHADSVNNLMLDIQFKLDI